MKVAFAILSVAGTLPLLAMLNLAGLSSRGQSECCTAYVYGIFDMGNQYAFNRDKGDTIIRFDIAFQARESARVLSEKEWEKSRSARLREAALVFADGSSINAAGGDPVDWFRPTLTTNENGKIVLRQYTG